MSESKHTPGPWIFADRGGHDLWGGPNGAVKVMNTEWGTAIPNYMDARLIAAAPDMLEALQGAAEFIESVDPGSYTLRDVRAAIAKAEGQ